MWVTLPVDYDALGRLGRRLRFDDELGRPKPILARLVRIAGQDVIDCPVDRPKPGAEPIGGS